MANEENLAENTAQNQDDMHALRRQKAEAFRSRGMNIYGRRVDGLTSSTEVKAAFEALPEGSEEKLHYKVAGRLMLRRIMGKASFAKLQDQPGSLQLYVQKNEVGDEAYALFKEIDLGDLISAEGYVFRTRTGEISLHVEKLELLAKSLRPMPEKFHGMTDTEQRYRQRYVDLFSREDVRRVFEKRSQMIREIRKFLESRGFMEVETPMMQNLAGGAAARPFKTYYNALGCQMYLRIAPELFLKRLIVGGLERVYEIGRNFRNEGMDRRHNPEFTCLELYQAYSDCRGMMEIMESMLTTVAQNVFGTLEFKAANGNVVNLQRPWRVAPYQELVKEKMGADWYDLDLETQRRKAKELGLDIDDSMDSLHVTHEIYDKLIESTLIQPTFVTRLPAFLVPLAKRCEDDPSLVDVYELEINGQEISPGYSELNDPDEQRARFDSQLIGRDDLEGEVDRIDEDFLTALEFGMPPTGGLGMGIDRVVMLMTGAESIRDVILFPQMRPQKAAAANPAEADQQ
ncbi:MAG: lysine--tRNA ligase [Victivallales bacterium]|nr:lysine--tRNA ligase [Victivallales bacterium]